MWERRECKDSSGDDARLPSAGGEADFVGKRCAERSPAEVRLAARGSDAGKYIPGSDAGAFAPGSNKARFSLSAERWEDQNQVVVVGSQTGE